MSRRDELTHLREAVATGGSVAGSSRGGEVVRRARRGAPSRRAAERGSRPLRRALELAVACGAGPIEEDARSELYAAGGRPRAAALTGVGSLTASEQRVADLAAAGDGNRDIAQALFVTPKTVETHLSSVYRKLGIRSRRELPAALAVGGSGARRWAGLRSSGVRSGCSPMRPGSDQPIISVMEDETVGIHLELKIAGDSLTGRARDDRGATREFDGRLGLLAAIDTLIAPRRTRVTGHGSVRHHEEPPMTMFRTPPASMPRAGGRRVRPVVSAAVLVALLVASGCSDDDEGGEASGPDPSGVTAEIGTLPDDARAIMEKAPYESARWIYYVADAESGEVLLANRARRDGVHRVDGQELRRRHGLRHARPGHHADDTGLLDRARSPMASSPATSCWWHRATWPSAAATDSRADSTTPSAPTPSTTSTPTSPRTPCRSATRWPGSTTWPSKSSPPGVTRVDGDVLIDTSIWDTFAGQAGPTPPDLRQRQHPRPPGDGGR